MIKGLNPAEMVKGHRKGRPGLQGLEQRLGQVGGRGAGIGAKVSGWLAGIAAVAWVVMWFIPGVKPGERDGGPRRPSRSMPAFSAIALSSASQELHIRAAGAAKTEGEFETQAKRPRATRRRTRSSASCLLVGGLAFKILGRAKFAQRYLNVGAGR